jgi:hypothetical protein
MFSMLIVTTFYSNDCCGAIYPPPRIDYSAQALTPARALWVGGEERSPFAALRRRRLSPRRSSTATATATEACAGHPEDLRRRPRVEGRLRRLRPDLHGRTGARVLRRRVPPDPLAAMK